MVQYNAVVVAADGLAVVAEIEPRKRGFYIANSITFESE